MTSLLPGVLLILAGCSAVLGFDDGTDCTTDTDCDAGQFCDLANGKCTTGAGDADADADTDADTDADADSDSDTDTALGTCADGKLDPNTGLCWEDPGTSSIGSFEAANTYCEEFADAAGNSDWRLPTIDELRGLIRGCSKNETGGACRITDACAATDCSESSCSGDPVSCACDWGDECQFTQGPGDSGWYWPAGLTTEGTIFYSSTEVSDETGYYWGVDFRWAKIHGVDGSGGGKNYRCVRQAE